MRPGKADRVIRTSCHKMPSCGSGWARSARGCWPRTAGELLDVLTVTGMAAGPRERLAAAQPR
jgi:hypothetical protein